MKLFVAMIVALVLPLQFVGALPAHAAGSITFTPVSGGPGQTVEIQGAGFAAGTFTVTEPFPTPQSQSVAANSNGNLIAFFTVPAGTPTATYTVQVTDASGAAVASGNFTVTTAPALSLNSAANVKPNTSVTVAGTGFGTGSQVTLRLLYTNTSGQAQSKDFGPVSVVSGAFSTSVTIPSDARAGGFTIDAYAASTATGSIVATVSGTIAAGTAITLTPSTGPAGTTTSVTVAGTGFGSNETVTINYTATLSTNNGTGNTSPISKQVETDTSGSFTTTLAVPSTIVAGTYTVTAIGTTSNLQASAALTITPHPAISLDPASTAPGTVVVVTGQLFAPNLPITVSATIPTSTGNVNLSGQTSTDSAGAFSARLFVPSNAVSGAVPVTATEAQAPGGASSATATLTIRGVQGTITASPLSATPGTIITISGAGFAAGPNAPVTVTASIPVVGGGSQVVSTTKDTDSNGAFTGAELLIPVNAAPGGITLSASQPTSGATATTVIAIVAPAPTPTATPTPSPTPTSTPTATPKPTSTPTPKRVVGLHFQHLSVRYRVAHVGTFNRIDVQANVKAKLGIWVHVLFPSGRHWDYFQHTDPRGHWARSFSIPYNATSRFTKIVHIELQLWKGKTTVKDFIPFTIIP